MGLFGNSEHIDLSDPGQVQISGEVRQGVPDVGDYFLDWIGGLLSPERLARLKAEVDNTRANGLVVPARLSGVPIPMSRKQTPLSFLMAMSDHAIIPLTVWGSYPRRGGDLKRLERTLDSVARSQGHAAAAAWAIAARPDTRLRLEDLANDMIEGFEKGVERVENRDVIKAFKNWST